MNRVIFTIGEKIKIAIALAILLLSSLMVFGIIPLSNILISIGEYRKSKNIEAIKKSNIFIKKYSRYFLYFTIFSIIYVQSFKHDGLIHNLFFGGSIDEGLIFLHISILTFVSIYYPILNLLFFSVFEDKSFPINDPTLEKDKFEISTNENIADALLKWTDLYERGGITREEYLKVKNKILGDL